MRIRLNRLEDTKAAQGNAKFRWRVGEGLTWSLEQGNEQPTVSRDLGEMASKEESF